MHIVLINDFSFARGGATSIFNQNVECALSRDDVSLTVIVGDDGKYLQSVSEVCEIIALGGRSISVRSGRNIYRGIFNIGCYKAVTNYISMNDTADTIYHVHGWSKILSPSLFFALSSVSDRVVVHAHDYFYMCPIGAFVNFKTSSICHYKPLGVKCLLSACDKRNYYHKLWRVARYYVLRIAIGDFSSWGGVVYLHKKMSHYASRSEIRPEKSWVIPNPVSMVPKSRVKAELNTRCYFIGRVEIEKGVESVLEACRSAGLPMEIIGDGADLRVMEEKFPEVKFHGWVDRRDLRELMKKARVVVVPSVWPEPFGLVIVEAISAGVPVIVSDRALLATDIKAKRLGMVIDVESKDAIYSALVSFLRMDVNEVAAMSKRCREMGSHLYNTENGWCDVIYGCYRSLIS